MVLVVATALLITDATQDLSFGTIDVFSGCLVFAGYRALDQKCPKRGDRSAPLDYLAAVLMPFVSLGMVGFGTFNALTTGNARVFLLATFGVLGSVFLGYDALPGPTPSSTGSTGTSPAR